MNTIVVHSHYHLGDCLILAHNLRAFARQKLEQTILFFLNGCNIPEITPAVEDLTNIKLLPFEAPEWAMFQRKSVDGWKNRGAHGGDGKPYVQGAWEKSPHRWDWSAYHLEYHHDLSRLLGYEPVFHRPEHLFFDYPALEYSEPSGDHSFYVCNAEPNSGQFSHMRQHGSRYLDGLIRELSDRYRVITSEDLRHQGFSLTEGANIACACRHHIYIATGPMWPCLSTHANHTSSQRTRIVMLDSGERLNMPGILQVGSVNEVEGILKERGLL